MSEQEAKQESAAPEPNPAPGQDAAILAEAADPHEIRAFATVVSLAEEGRLHADLSRELSQLIATLQEQAVRGAKQKVKGKMALTLNFTFDGEFMEVSGDYKVDRPKESRGRSIFWVTGKNTLSRRNPRQQELVFDATPKDRGPARAV